MRSSIRFHLLAASCAAVAALAACDSSSTTAPDESLTLEQAAILEALPELTLSETVAFDRAGIGAHAFPDSIDLTAEQKAAIARLHEQFRVANKADLEALAKLGVEIRAAMKTENAREKVKTLLERAAPIQRRLAEALKALGEAIWNIYTPKQKAWLEQKKERVCRPDNALQLTEDQRRKIAVLREAFAVAVKPDLELIKSVADEAHRAREAGKSREEVGRILAKAAPAVKRVREAEARLEKAIDDLLTAEQRAKKCVKGKD